METYERICKMNVHVFEEVKKLIHKHQPKSFCEIGCHNGLTAKAVCREIATYYPRLKYFGYDAFGQVDPIEHNGKSQSSEVHRKHLESRLKGVKREFKFFSWEIQEGLTINTLTTPLKFGLVYIDGGHSYETVMHDYNMTKESKIIIFDDYNLGGVRQAVDEIGKGYLLKEFDDWKKKVWVIVNE